MSGQVLVRLERTADRKTTAEKPDARRRILHCSYFRPHGLFESDACFLNDVINNGF